MADSYDPPWKEIISDYFPDFMAFFFLDAHADIDWSRPWETLDKELVHIVRDAVFGRRIADKLVRVWLKSGEPEDVLIHTEVQGQKEDDFERRMYTYNYRVFDVYGHEVVSFAILTDEKDDWHPESYEHGRWGSKTRFTFRAVKLIEYDSPQRWAELEVDPNVFATVVMAYLKARQTRKDPASRLRWKTRLVRGLYERGSSRQKILDLFRFIDWVMALPPGLEQRFKRDHEQYEAKSKMRYVTSIERIGREEGRKEGKEKGILMGEVSLLKSQIRHRFAEIPEWVETRLTKANREELETWGRRLLDAHALEDVFAT